jgi:hypothetical protein
VIKEVGCNGSVGALREAAADAVEVVGLVWEVGVESILEGCDWGPGALGVGEPCRGTMQGNHAGMPQGGYVATASLPSPPR